MKETEATDLAWTSPLVECAPCGSNPGNLRMFQYIPRGLASSAPLIVILHGCGQTAAEYDAGTGWSRLADQFGFALLAPEQKRANNPHTCFNWFNPEDVRHGEGEVASIAAMIGQTLASYRLDAKRVYITGLSAGGAMASAMLATYPQLFAGGAIIAGLPFGAASNLRDALEAMRNAPLRTPGAWGDLVRAASSHQGSWPVISIWHGGLDSTVNISNAQASVAQWANLHGLALTRAKQQMVGSALRWDWGDSLELYTLPSLGHGVPIDAQDLGQPGAFILQAGISSTRRIAQFWRLLPGAAERLPPAGMFEEPTRGIAETIRTRLPEIEDIIATQDHMLPVTDRSRESLIRRALAAVGLRRKS